MDAVTAFAASPEGGEGGRRFVVTRVKRGGPTWTTAAVDGRVSPLRRRDDRLNVEPSCIHNWRTYGAWRMP